MSVARILVVEDQALVALNLARRLEKQGYRVIGPVASGEEAVELAVETVPDLVLMDIQLEGNVDGIEAADQIRLQLEIPVVFLTALASEETIRRARITAPYGYLLKPFEERELRAAIEMALYRHQMERKLMESEQRYRQLAELSPDAIIVAEAGKIVLVNPAACALLGVEESAELIGRSFLEFAHPDTQQVAQQMLQYESSRKVPSQLLEQKIVRRDGSVVEIEAASVPITYQDELAVQIVARDITPRKQATKAKYQARKLESLTALAGGVAHDFNNLLVAMLGQIGLAAAKLPAGSEPSGHLGKATEAAERASELAEQLLVYSGRGAFHTQLIDLNALVLGNIRMFSAIVPAHIDIRTKLGTTRPFAEGDIAQLREVMVNLVLNAVQAIGEQPGIITIGVNTIDVSLQDVHLWRFTGDPLPPGRYHTLEVQDSGPGLDEATKERVFDPFFTTKPPANGLGLATVLGVVRGFGGGLGIENGSGGGTTFKLLFPTGKEVSPRENVGVDSSPLTAVAGTLLVIDDEMAVREAVVDILQEVSIQVITAESGQVGLEKYQAYRDDIDLVLLDLSMPEMNGDETYQQLCRIDPDVRVVLSSGYDKLNVMRRFDNRGLQGFLQKPYDMTTLIEMVQKQMGVTIG